MRRFSVPLLAITFCLAFPDAAAAKKTKEDRAVAITKQAIKQYRNGVYRNAAELFYKAYELSKRPAQLRNAAKAYEEGEMLDKALALWRRYRDHEGITADERREAEAHVALIRERQQGAGILRAAEEARAAALEAKVEAEAARAAAVEAQQVKTTVEEEPVPVLGYVALAAGAGLGAVSAVLWFKSSSQLDDLDVRLDERNAAGLITGITPAQVDDEVSSINSQRIVSGVLLTVGIAAVGTGIVWLVASGSNGDEDLGSPMVELGEDRFGLHWTGRF